MIPRTNPKPPRCSCGGIGAHTPWCVKLERPPRVEQPKVPLLPDARRQAVR